ncbi:MAG: hypothetical protein LBT20_04800 [Clostridiales bacterium]|jgi:hypothetical protein|nr:hypothetical protein [Clostridiales bacterium]
MKGLRLDYQYYLFPNSFKDIAELLAHIKADGEDFIPLKRLLDDKCKFPYFIEEETQSVYRRFKDIGEIEEVEVHLLSKAEYIERLKALIPKVCLTCDHYIDDGDEDIETLYPWANMTLDGECYRYSKKQSLNEGIGFAGK